MDTYSHHFFAKRHNLTEYSAHQILEIVLPLIPEVNSAVDLGCGVGTWLSVLKGRGVKDVLGVDGSWLEKDLLQIEQSEFVQKDFDGKIDVGRRFDLAISLEVAEHLKPESARGFVETMVGFSDFNLFSAAIPHQAKKHHINEQWPQYWCDLYAAHGYVCFDLVRSKVWNDDQMPAWYRQNTFLYVKKDRLSDLNLNSVDLASRTEAPMALVHPSYYLSKVESTRGVKNTWKLFRRALKASLKG